MNGRELGAALHTVLDDRMEAGATDCEHLRRLADDLEQDGAAGPLLSECSARDGEFWQRLAGSVRKAAAMI